MDRVNYLDSMFEKYQMIFDHSPLGICITEIDGSVTMNNTFCAMLGYTHTELLEAGWKDIIYKKDMQKYHELFDIYSEDNNGTKIIEIRFVKKDSTIICAEVTSKIKNDEEGKAVFLVSMIKDISEYKIIQEKLKQNESRYKELFENNPNPMWLYDTQSLKFLMVNHAAVANYGYSYEEFLVMTIKDIRPQEDIPSLLSNLDGINTTINESETWRHKKKDGSIILVKISSHSIRLNGYIARVIMALDVTEKVAAKQNLEVEVAKLKSIIESTSDAIFSVDKNYCYTSYNSTHATIMKILYAVDIEIGKSLLAFMTVDVDKMKAKSNIDRTLNGESLCEIAVSGEESLSQRFFEVSHNPIKDEFGSVIGVSVFAKDITERKLSADAFHESQQFIEGIINAIPVRVFWKDKNLVYIGCNSVFAHDAGFTDPKEIIGKDDFQMVWREQAELYQSDDRKVIDSGESRILFEESQSTPDGNRITLLTSKIPLRNLRGECIGLLGTYIDITEQKIAFNKVKQLSQAVEQSPVTIVITDTAGKIQYVNQKGLELTGYKMEELLNNNPKVFNSGEKAKEDYEFLWKTILAGNEWRGEFHNKKKNGELYWESATISPFKNNSNEITNFLAVKEDITDRKEREQELIAAKEKAEEINRIKSIFFSNMSHELRTPLVGILGFADILSNNLDDENDRTMASSILKSGKRLLTTLTSLMNLSELETLKADIEKVNIDANLICSDLVNHFKVNTTNTNLEFKTEFNSDSLNIKINSKLFRESITQLLNNAVTFTENGHVLIKTYQKRTINSKEVLGIIEIIDTGIGIPLDKQKVVFEEFRQASEGHGRDFEGTGLGLTLTKKYVELMGGTIELQSEVGQGTKVTLSFPMNEKCESTLVEENVQPLQSIVSSNLIKDSLSAKKDRKILIVEDDGINRAFLEKCFAKVCSFKSVGSGSEAIQSAVEEKFDLLLMDINLTNDMSGITATQAIRKITGYEKVPIVAMTAYTAPEEIEEFLAKGCSHYISKPFIMNELLTLVDEILVAA